MDRNQEQLLTLLSGELFGNGSGIELTEQIIKEAKLQAVSSIIVPDEYQTIANNIRVIYAHAELTKLLRDFSFTTIKGYTSAYYYPEPIKRTMGDVDFYVDEKDIKKIEQIMLENGYEVTDKGHIRHESFKKNRIIFELHSEIKGVPNGKDGIRTSSKNAEELVRYYLSDLIETANRVQTEYGIISIPDEFHHGLVMLLHVAGHMMNGEGVGLRHLCDWAVYVNKVDIVEYKMQFEEMGLWKFACQLTALSSKYLGVPEKTWSGRWDQQFLDCFIEDILDAGNFGRKDTGRAAGLKMNSEESKTVSLFLMTRNRFKFFERNPALLPVGILLYTIIYLEERITGKKKWVRIGNVQQGAKRQKLYKEFQLFK